MASSLVAPLVLDDSTNMTKHDQPKMMIVTSKPALGDRGYRGHPGVWFLRLSVQVEFGKFQKDELNRANRYLEPTEMAEVVDRTDRQERLFQTGCRFYDWMELDGATLAGSRWC